jgi:hypothetical protein
MFRLEYGKSYIWAFPIYALLFVGGFALCNALGDVKWAILAMPAFVAPVLLCELRSGVALDSWWRASYRKGDWQYAAILAWHTIGLVLLLAMSYIFIARLS